MFGIQIHAFHQEIVAESVLTYTFILYNDTVDLSTEFTVDTNWTTTGNDNEYYGTVGTASDFFSGLTSFSDGAYTVTLKDGYAWTSGDTISEETLTYTFILYAADPIDISTEFATATGWTSTGNEDGNEYYGTAGTASSFFDGSGDISTNLGTAYTVTLTYTDFEVNSATTDIIDESALTSGNAGMRL